MPGERDAILTIWIYQWQENVLFNVEFPPTIRYSKWFFFRTIGFCFCLCIISDALWAKSNVMPRANAMRRAFFFLGKIKCLICLIDYSHWIYFFKVWFFLLFSGDTTLPVVGELHRWERGIIGKSSRGTLARNQNASYKREERMVWLHAGM